MLNRISSLGALPRKVSSNDFITRALYGVGVFITTRSKKATLNDVARRAGVSVTTASYILNGRSTQMRISEETARRVQAAMQDLSYRPNWSARNLRRATTRTIGVISDSVASRGFSNQLLTGASAAARESDHLLVIGESLGDSDAELLLIENMIDRQVDGIIYATHTASFVQLPPALEHVRTVLLNCADPTRKVPGVLPDDEGGGRVAVELLIAAGIEGPFYVVGQDPTPTATAGVERVRGIRSALKQSGRDLAGVVACPWTVEPTYHHVHQWLGAGARPAALICLNDRVAMGVYQALAEHDLRVPEDVAVIAFDGSELADWLRPRLTSLAIPFAEMGRLAVSLLLEPGPGSSGVTRLPLRLCGGESVVAGLRATGQPGHG